MSKQKIETPLTNHITNDDLQMIYGPAEDSFLLLDAIESEIDSIHKLNPKICLEIGCGSGIIITAFAKTFPNIKCFATDINRNACEITNKTAKLNNVNVEIIQMDLATMFKSNTIDILLFNPPYVVTNSIDDDCDDDLKSAINVMDENDDKTINYQHRSWAGGCDGREVMNRVFSNLNDILSDTGRAYCLVIKDNKPQEIITELENMNFQVECIAERKIPCEHLFILKIQKCKL